MHLRRVLGLAIGLLLLAGPLSACGFDYATDRINSITPGASNRDASVDVLGAVIVSSSDGSGTFIASFVNNDVDNDNTVDEIVGTDQAQQVTAKDFSTITVGKNSLVNLADATSPVKLTGQFSAGDYVPLRISFGSGESVELNVPVVTNCGTYAGLDGTGGDCTSDNSPSPSTE